VTAGVRTRPQVFFLDGAQLRHLRQQRGFSQQKLADNAGVSLTTVARLERQPCAPCRGRTLGRLARALGKHPVQLLTISRSRRGNGLWVESDRAGDLAGYWADGGGA
jgi:transcriptional regulator with XRE-family HTH domain